MAVEWDNSNNRILTHIKNPAGNKSAGFLFVLKLSFKPYVEIINRISENKMVVVYFHYVILPIFRIR